MSNKSVYHLSARQIWLLAFASALIAVGATALVYTLGSYWQKKDGSGVTFAENSSRSITDPSAATDEQNSIEVYKAISPGVAFISTTSYTRDPMWGDIQEGQGAGSGSVIDANGDILTNYHVIEGATKVNVNFGGDKVYPAKVIGGDPDTDLAVIKIETPPEGLTIVPLGDSDKLEVGQKVLAIGNPFGLDRTLTTGVISGLQRPIRARNNHPIDAAIQTDASINPGNSGGPLLDKFGKMIGINSQILSPGGGGSVGVGFAIPVNIAKQVVPQLIQYGEVRRPKLGADLLSVEQLNQQVRLPVQSGLLVRATVPGGSAAVAGIHGLTQDNTGDVVLGDIITSIDGDKMGSLDDLYRLLDKKKIGDTVQIQIYRDGKTLTVPVRLNTTPQTSRPTTRRTTQE
ncbi:MAG: trypsin-like peptidase domain-containing protein [Acidobacteriota bacterium]